MKKQKTEGTTKEELLPITYDFIFKRIFACEGNEDILKDLLEAILNIEIQKITIKNPEMVKDRKNGKSGTLDIKVELEDKTIIDVEMQAQNKYNMEERLTTYAGKLISEQLDQGNQYTKLNKTIIICILNYNCIQRNSYHNIAQMRYKETEEKSYVNVGYKKEKQIASDYIEVHILEIPKFRRSKAGIKDKLEQWMWLFAGKKEMIEMARKENEKVDKAVKALKVLSVGPEQAKLYESIRLAEFLERIGESNREKILLERIKEGRIKGRKEGMEQGIAQGIEQGITQEKLEIAKKMLQRKINTKEIMEITGLKEKELKSIVV